MAGLLTRLRDRFAPARPGAGTAPGPELDSDLDEKFAGAIHALDAAMGLPRLAFLDRFDAVKADLIARGGRRMDEPQTALLAVKLFNLLLTRHEYTHRQIRKLARPTGFMLDPANGCQLGCATCANTFNAEFSESLFHPWPAGVMKPDLFQKFIDEVAPTAFAGHFYNKHEPFLNKRTPDFVAKAADWRVETLISSNFSFPKLDVEAIVASGLRELMLAIDGVTQETYVRYRRGGEVGLVFDNVRRLVAARRKLNMTTPYLRWQFLTFEHNVHEVPAAIEQARALGFDEFNLATPHDVSADDPSLRAVSYAGPAEHHSVVFTPRPILPFTNDLSRLAPAIRARLHESALARHAAEIGDDPDESLPRTGEDQCDWLHLGVIADAHGRIMPCCIGNRLNAGHLQFGSVAADGGRLLDSANHRAARLLLANPAAFGDRYAAISPIERVRCVTCTHRPPPQIGLGAADSYLRGTGARMAPGLLDGPGVAPLVGWSRHVTVCPEATAQGAVRAEEALPKVAAGSLVIGYEGEITPERAGAPADLVDRLTESPYASGVERRRGPGALAIGDLRLLDRASDAALNGAPTLLTGGGIKIAVKLMFQDAVETPVVSLAVRNAEGKMMAAITSNWARRNPAPGAAGTARWVLFHFGLHVPPGIYFLEPGAAVGPDAPADLRARSIRLELVNALD